MTSLLRSVAGAVLLAGTTVLTWYAWLGRDTDHQLDANGNESGPYTTGQVAGCVLTLLALLVVAVMVRVHWLVAAAAVTVASTAAFTIPASSDETGLFMVGAVLVFAGTAAGSTLVALCVRLITRRGGQFAGNDGVSTPS